MCETTMAKGEKGIGVSEGASDPTEDSGYLAINTMKLPTSIPEPYLGKRKNQVV